MCAVIADTCPLPSWIATGLPSVSAGQIRVTHCHAGRLLIIAASASASMRLSSSPARDAIFGENPQRSIRGKAEP